ncbi:hypothetical protein BS50DRAFT_675458 [Corynespora cassiicola Philippines]|uniref:VOC domain-containing protein n=1 Tax=Corynespora cassiicola Philippines TaxID=1448308 RepID=A0A2T2NV10_CORCC|nr:hypothetical protein BS50DRAFT_675458 [Corynespora cassiicola Philippines]
MHFSIFITLLLPTIALACNYAQLDNFQEDINHENRTFQFKFIPGDDPPADPATKGYFVNHVSLLSSNLTATREWYSTVLGMRHIFTIHVSETYSIMYMGHSQGGRNSTGFQSGAEMIRDKNNMAGLMEFQHYSRHPTRRYTPQSTPHLTFSHMGLIVDSLSAAQARFDRLGVRTIKRQGAIDFSPEREENRIFAGAWGIPDLGDEQAQNDFIEGLPGMRAIGFGEFILVADPDGNLFEVQGRVGRI